MTCHHGLDVFAVTLACLIYCCVSCLFLLVEVVITGSALALALHCCKAHAKINKKIENSTPPSKIVTHKDISLKLGHVITSRTCDFWVESLP